jgi:hypothetical protein
MIEVLDYLSFFLGLDVVEFGKEKKTKETNQHIRFIW